MLLDVVRASDFGDSRVRTEVGDIAERSVLERVIDDRTSAIFHLAAIVSGQAEADFDLGMRINLDASRLLLEICRQRGHRPRVVFTSSVAVYGGELPDVVRDDTALNPQSSYGAQKAIAELLLNDYARRGFVDGRVLRLPTISVRPGRAECGGVVVRERHHPRAAERRSGRVSGGGLARACGCCRRARRSRA